MAASQTKKPAGYRLGKTCSLFFWPSTDIDWVKLAIFWPSTDKRQQSHLLVWDAVLQAHPSHRH